MTIQLNENFKEVGKLFFCNNQEYIGDYFSIPVEDYNEIKSVIQPMLNNVKFDNHLSDFIYTLNITEKKILDNDGNKVYDLNLAISFNLNHKWMVKLTNIQIYGKGYIKDDKAIKRDKKAENIN